MRTRIFILLCFLFSVKFAFSQMFYHQWIQTQSPTNSNLNYGCFANDLPTNYWAVGDNGTIIKTTNSGINWFSIASGTASNLYGICKLISNPTSLIAVGSNGTIIKSTNEGLNWQSVTSNTTQKLNAVRNIITSTYAMIAGNNGTLLYTTNGGSIWTPVNTGMTNDLFCISNNAFGNRIFFIGGSDGKILKVSLTYPPIPPLFNVTVINSISGKDIKSIVAIDSLNFYIAGTNGLVYQTTDGGITWINRHTSNSNNINALVMRITNDFYVFENGGVIERTQNNGTNWLPQITYTNQNINSAIFINVQKGFALGNAGTILTCYIPDTANTKKLDFMFGNRIKSYFENNGVFNQNTITANTAGFLWPDNDPYKTLIFTSGLNIAGMVNGVFRMSGASYTGEYWSGSINNFSPYTNEYHKIYNIKNTDNCYNNIDYANWGYAVAQGAPYIDVNHNNVFDACIDIPGVLNASGTMFMCLTDGFVNRHSSSIGMGGGTLPMNSQLRMTVWCYSDSIVRDVQYIKFQVINSGQYSWQNTFMALFTDPDIGNTNDDYIGCDIQRNLGYAYNGNNYDAVYGIAPPAVGMRLLRFAVNRSVTPNDTLKLSIFGQSACGGCPAPNCERDPNGEPEGFYNMMKGFKKDGSPWMDPTYTPPQPTKTIYPGDPETRTNWVESKGSVWNCGGTTGNIVDSNPPGDRRYIMGWGALNWVMTPGDTQVIVMAQLAARGSSNLNSVTKLKQLSDVALNYFNGILIGKSVSGIVRFNDNNQTVSNGYVKALKLNKENGMITTLDSAGIQSNGSYILTNVPVDSIYIGVYPNSTTTPDYIPGYYPGVINWQQAVKIYPVNNLFNIDIYVNRISNFSTSNAISGRVFKYADGGIKDAILYAKIGSTFVQFGFSDYYGIYHLSSVPNGILKVIVHRIGFTSDSISVTVSNNTVDSINFYLNQMYVGIKKEEGAIPQSYKLYQNYPNPFNPVTKIKFNVPTGSMILNETQNLITTLKIYDLLGREIATLVNDKLNPGIYEVTFDGKNLSSGIYFYKLSSGEFADTKRMVLIK